MRDDDPRRGEPDRQPVGDLRAAEEALREAFARWERVVPATEPLRAAIDATVARRRRTRRLARITGAALALLVVAAVPALVRTVGTAPPSVPAPVPPLASGQAAQPLDFLLLGVDGGDGGRSGHRADSVLMVHVPADRSRLYLVSLPRDLGVEMPGRGFGKLSESFYHGSHRPGGRPDLAAGAALTEATVTALTGVRFDGTASMTYAGLRRLTDAVGGVRLCLPGPVRSIHTGRRFPAGCQRLDGAAAVDLLRQRYSLADGAHDRDRNGQRFVAALLREGSDPAIATNPLRLSEIIRAVGAGLALDLDGADPVELVGGLREAAAADAVGIGWSHRPERVRGTVFEVLDPAESGSLFEAIRRDDLAGWVERHPHRVTR